MVIMLILAALEFGEALRANAGLRELAGWAGREAVVSYQVVSDGTLTATNLDDMIKARAKDRRYNLRGGTLTVTVTINQDVALLTVNRVRIVMTYTHPVSVPFLSLTGVPLSVDRTFYVPNASTV